MSHALTEEPQGLQSDATRLDSLFAAVRDSNPFSANRVNEPSPYDVDVQTIHAAGFDRLVVLAEQSRRDRKAIGTVLLGSAGIGKSHLLSRLYRWANEKGEHDRPRACYVFLHNILADPDRLPRYLLKCVVSLLSNGGHGPLHETSLFRLVHNATWHASKKAGADLSNSKQITDAYRAFTQTLAGGREVYEVLFQFLRHAHQKVSGNPQAQALAASALAWLSGEEIDAEAARALGLKVDGQESVVLHDDHDVEQVLLALTQLALVRGQPFVLCIDQVDNLDPDKVKALARFLQALLDHATNLLVIVSGVKETLLDFWKEGIIPQAAWDRIAQYKVELRRINGNEARQVLEARLEPFLEPFQGLEPVHRHLQEDNLFPLGRVWLQSQLGEALEFRPRDVLTWARDGWEEQQAKLARLEGTQWLNSWPNGPPQTPHEPSPPPTEKEIEAAIDAKVDQKIKEHIAQRKLQPGSLPPDAGNLAGLVQALLEQCRGDGLPYTFRGVERMKKKAGRLPPFDLRVRERRESDGKEITSGVLFVTNTGRSATTALGRLLEDEPPPDHRILATDHERRPLTIGPQGIEYYRDLTKLGREKFEHLKINFDQYAALDALEGVVGLARVGDLEVEIPKGTIRAVSEAEVVASHHRQDRYRNHPLLRPLLTEEPPIVAEIVETFKIDAKDVRQYIMAQLSWRLGMSAFEVTKGYLETQPALKLTLDATRGQVKEIASQMHAEGLIHATPSDDDLFLQRRK